MQFAVPGFLWGLLFITIPIIIHLFYFRRYKKVLFSNTQFLEEVKDERSSRNRLKHLLVLASRIFAIAFLVFAFAQPFIPFNGSKAGSKNAISVFLDNSYSMNAEGNGQLLFDEAKLAAKDVISAYGDNNRFQILTQDFEGKHQRLVSKSEALNLLQEIKPSPSAQNYAAIFERQKSVLKNEDGQKTVFMLSDFQKNQRLFNNDTAVAVNLLPFSPNTVRNVYMDSVWFEAPIQMVGMSNKLAVQLRNESSEVVSGTYQLTMNGISKAVSNYEINPDSYVIDTITFTISEEGWNKGVVALNDYPITFDDDYYFSFYVEKEVRVLSIGSGLDKTFNAVFKDIENVAYKHENVKQVNYNDIGSYHLVILDQLENIPSGLTAVLKDEVSNGLNVFIAPSNNSSIPSYNQLLSALKIGSFGGVNESGRTVSRMNTLHPALSDLFDDIPSNLSLPKVKRHFILRAGAESSAKSLFSFRNGDAFLSSFSADAGEVFVLTAPLSKTYSDFITHPVFAPVVYKMAILGVKSARLAYPIEPNTVMKINSVLPNAESIVKMLRDDIEIIPQQMMYDGSIALQVKGELLTSGFYQLTTDNGSFEEWISLNYNRTESSLKYYSPEVLEQSFPERNVSVLTGNIVEISQQLKQQVQGKSFWKLCIVLSLLFLAFEILLLRLFRNT